MPLIRVPSRALIFSTTPMQNIMRTLRLMAVCMVSIFIQFSASAQSLPVGTTAIEDYYRRAQLSGKTDTNVSFTFRPLFPDQINNSYLKNSSDTLSDKLLLGCRAILSPWRSRWVPWTLLCRYHGLRLRRG